MLDEELLKKMVLMASENNRIIEASGAVPGTAPIFVSSAKSFEKKSGILKKYCSTQLNFNSQLNLERPKRVVIFEKFLDKFKDLYKTPLRNFLQFCGTQKGVEFVLSYTSSAQMSYFKKCPSCGCEKSTVLHSTQGNPVTGFLTKFSEYYFICQKCSMVYLNPTLPENDLGCYYDSHSYPAIHEIGSLKKHYDSINRNSTSTYYNFESVSNDIQQLPEESNALDIGGGIGEFSVYLRKNYPKFNILMWDYRVDSEVIKELNHRKIKSYSCNFLNEPIKRQSFDLITNWEVVEHLPIMKLDSYFKKIAKALTSNGLYILSTPDFDSPYAQALDFWACFPGEHLSVLSRAVLEPILNNCGLKIVSEYHESVTMDFSDAWFGYGMENNASIESKSQASIINDFLKYNNTNKGFREYMRNNNLGSELILCMKKINA
jgi:2-polyprenyl-3-methyl-5-hydroxy-6-metoxy-1,4-benzoquinol methylase